MLRLLSVSRHVTASGNHTRISSVVASRLWSTPRLRLSFALQIFWVTSEHSKRLRLWSTEVGSLSCKMSSDSSPPLTHSITLSSQLAQPIQIVAAPHISYPEFRSAIDSSLFKQWLKNTESENGILHGGSMSLTRVLIQGVDMFGQQIGFLKFQADVFDKQTGKKVPGIVFARGPAVAVLILLESEGKTYAVLTEQARVPVGRIILELPAGMLDVDKGDFLGAAIREVSLIAQL